MRLGEVEPVFGQTGRVVLDITARTAHDGALKWTRAPSTPRAAEPVRPHETQHLEDSELRVQLDPRPEALPVRLGEFVVLTFSTRSGSSG